MAIVHSHLSAVSYKRMVLLFDKDSEGPAINQQAALITTFALTLHQQASPVLVPYSVANGFLEKKYNTMLEQSDWDKKLYELVEFNVAQWRIFHVKNSQFFLWIPVSMPWITTPETITIEGVSIEVPSIKMGALDQFQGSDVQALRTWVKAKEDASQEMMMSQLEALFFTGNDIKKDPKVLSTVQKGESLADTVALISSLTTPWNMFIQGHGSYEERIGNLMYIPSVAGLRIKSFQELLLLLNRLNSNVIALSSCYAGGKNLDYIQFKDNLDRQKFAQNLKYILAVISSSDSPSTIMSYMSTSTQTIGSQVTTTRSINLSQGLNIKSYFDELDKMAGANWLSNALRYLARGAQHEAAENVPQILFPNAGWAQAFMPVKESSLTEQARVSELNKIEKKLEKPNLSEIQKDVLSRRKAWLIQQQKQSTPEEEARHQELEKIENYLKDSNIPKDMMPMLLQRKAFLTQLKQEQSAQPTSPIQSIGNTLIKKHEIEKTPILIKQKSIVLLYPTMIPVPLVIEPLASKFPIILSMQKGDAAHVISSVSLTPSSDKPVGIQTFIRQAFMNLKGRRAKKTFLIKTLKGFNDFSEFLDQNNAKVSITDNEITLNQVLVHTSTNAQNHITLKLYFMLKGNYWAWKFYGTMSGSGDMPTFPCTQIQEAEFTTALATLDPAVQKLDQQLAADLQDKPTWKISVPKKVPETGQSELEKRLSVIKQKLSTLNLNLEKLKNNLKTLSDKLQAPQV